MAQALQSWAVPQLAKLLPIDEESLKQIILYTDKLPREAAADHLKNLLGDSPAAFEFISSFNSRRPIPPSERGPSSAQSTGTATARRDPPGSATAADSDGHNPGRAPKSGKHKKTKEPFNKLPPQRRPDNYGDVAGGYMKKGDEEYFAGTSKAGRKPERRLASTLALKGDLDGKQSPLTSGPAASNPTTTTNQQHGARAANAKLPPSAAGALISDSAGSSRSSSPALNKAKATKVNVAGGLSMRGQSTTINDLDSAIRSLEVQTNPSIISSQDAARRRCNCMAQRHALLAAAPNCLNCGKIICAKEGLGPCTFCGKPLLSSEELQAMVKVLREERGKEVMEANNAAHKKAEVSRTPRPFANVSTPPLSSSAPSSDSESERLEAARKHRDRLLKFQADNARRTQIHDEAADFETPDAGLNQWATPQERALQLKRQQQVLREQEWNSRPDYEKRKMVVSIDVVGGKAVRRMAKVERPSEMPSEDEDDHPSLQAGPVPGDSAGGAFSRNPLLGQLIRPVIAKKDAGKSRQVAAKSTWRRVQDDNDDNEHWILDGGAYGGMVEGRVLGSDEPACG